MRPGPSDRARPSLLLVIDALDADAGAATAVADAVRDAEAGREVAVATFDLGDGRQASTLEAAGAVVHHVWGPGSVGRAVALRRLRRGLDPEVVEVLGGSTLVRAVAR